MIYTILGVAGWFATALTAMMWWREMNVAQEHCDSAKFWYNHSTIQTDNANTNLNLSEYHWKRWQMCKKQLRALEKQRVAANTLYHSWLSLAHDENHALTTQLEKAEAELNQWRQGMLPAVRVTGAKP